MGQAERRVDCVLIVIHLRAEGAPCKRMIRIAVHLNGSSISHLDQKAAGIRTIIRADGPFDFASQEASFINPFLFCLDAKNVTAHE